MQQHTTSARVLSSSVLSSSYELHLLDPERLAQMTVTLTDGTEEKFLLPDGLLLPSAILADPLFRDGVVAGFEVPLDVFDLPSLALLVNRLTYSFLDDLRLGGCYPWTIGYQLASLSLLAQEDEVAARLGIAHLCFLMSLVPWLPVEVLPRYLGNASHASACAVRTYRAQVQALKSQGVTFADAERFSLVGYALNGWSPDFCASDEEEVVA